MSVLFRLVMLLAVMPLLWAMSAPAAGHSWRVVSEPFPPYFSPDLPEQGWLWQVTRAALESQGIDVSLEFMSWTRAMRLTASDKCTAALGAFYSEQRAQTYIYSRPLAFSQSGLFKLQGNRQVRFNGDLGQLSPFHISKGELDLVTETLNVQSDLQVSETASLETSLKLLLAGRVDLVAGTKEVGEYWLANSPELHSLARQRAAEFIEPALAVHSMHLIFPRADADAVQKRDIFNRGFAEIYASGKLQLILAEHGFTEGQIIGYVQTMGLK